MAHTVSGANLSDIITRLNAVDEQHPFEAETYADWATEAGDVVTVTRGNDSYTSTVHTSKTVWKGAPQTTLTSTGNQERDAVNKVSKSKYSSLSSITNSQNVYQAIITSYNGMTAGLVLASSSASLYVQDMYNQMKSGLDLTSSSAHLYVIDAYNQMSAGLALTSSSAALYVDNAYAQMRSGLDLTSSTAHLYVQDAYNQMSSGLALTSSSAALYVENMYTQMKSGLDLTSSSAALYVDNVYEQMKAGLDLTSSSAALYVDNKYTQMSSGLELSSSSAAVYVDNKYTQMSSGLALSSSSATVYVNNKYTQMQSGLALTSSSAAVYVNNKYTQMTSGLKLASSSAAVYVNNKYTQMTSGLKLTSSSAAVYARSLYDQMKSGLSLTASSAALFVEGKTSRAAIIETINDTTGVSKTKIEASIVDIDGDTIVDYLSGQELDVDSLTASVVNAEELYLGKDDLEDVIYAFTGVEKKVDGDEITLKFSRIKGDPVEVTFNKAAQVGSYVVSNWSGNLLTVEPSESGSESYSARIGSRFNYYNNQYYIEAFKTENGSTTSISNTTTYYQIGFSRAGTQADPFTRTTTAIIVDSSGNRIISTPTKSLSLFWDAAETSGRQSATLGDSWGESNGTHTVYNTSNIGNAIITRITSVVESETPQAGTTIYYVKTKSQKTSEGSATDRLKKVISLNTGGIINDSRTITLYFDNEATGLSYNCTDFSMGKQAATLSDEWDGGTHTVYNVYNANRQLVTEITSVFESETPQAGTTVYYVSTKSQRSDEQSATNRIRKTISLDPGTVSSGNRTITLKFDNQATGLTYSCPDYGNGMKAATLDDGWNGGVHTVYNTSNSSNDLVTTITSVCESDSGVYSIKTMSQKTGEGSATERLRKTISLSPGTLDTGLGRRTITFNFNNAATGLTYTCNDYASGSPVSGTASGKTGSSYDWTFRIRKGDGTSKDLTINASPIYSDARVGYVMPTQRLNQDTWPTSSGTRSIPAGTYCNGAQTLLAVSTENITPDKIKKGVRVRVGDSQDGGRIKDVTGEYEGLVPARTVQEDFYSVSTNTRYIYAGTYCEGTQTLYGVTTENIEAEYIKDGITIKVGDSSNGGKIKNVTGTYKAEATHSVSAYSPHRSSDGVVEMESGSQYSNGGGGRKISGMCLTGKGTNATCYLVTYGTWYCDGTYIVSNRSGYLDASHIYKQGYADGGSGSGIPTKINLNTKVLDSPPTDFKKHSNNYYYKGDGASREIRIYSWPKINGVEYKDIYDYLGIVPTAVWSDGFAAGQEAGGGGGDTVWSGVSASAAGGTPFLTTKSDGTKVWRTPLTITVTRASGSSKTISDHTDQGTIIYNTDHSMYCTADSGTTKETAKTIKPGTSTVIYPCFTKTDGTLQWGTACTVSAESAASYTSLGSDWSCTIQTSGDEKHYTLQKTVLKNKPITGLSDGGSYHLYK